MNTISDMTMKPRPKIVVVLHQERSSPGRVGQKLIKRGFDLDIRRPALGQALPETMDNHAGAVIFGGPGSANDNEEWVKRETDWIAEPLKAGKPFFGICLGGQMLANHLGGKVYERPYKRVEIGYYPLETVGNGGESGPFPDMIYHFHREGLTAPDSAKILATSELYPHQAFSMDEKTVGIQFHVELTLAMMCRWTVHGAHRFVLPNAQNRKQHLQGRLEHDHKSEKWLEGFLDHWIGTGEDHPVI